MPNDTAPLHVLVERRKDAMNLQIIAGNPVDEQDLAMFEREGWDNERPLAYIRDQITSCSATVR